MPHSHKHCVGARLRYNGPSGSCQGTANLPDLLANVGNGRFARGTAMDLPSKVQTLQLQPELQVARL